MCFLTFLFPIQGLFYILSLFVLIDTLFAIYAVVKKDGWKNFRSVLLRKGLGGKIWLYYGTTLLVYLMEIYLIGTSSFGIKHIFTKGLVGIWCSNELRSVDENSISLGNRPFLTMIKDAIKLFTGIKKDIKKVIKD
jgi:hypothetical protein